MGSMHVSCLRAQHRARRGNTRPRRARLFASAQRGSVALIVAFSGISAASVVNVAPAAASGITYVGRVASATGTSSTRVTSATLTVGAAGVQVGDALLGSALFGSTTSLTGAVTITDAAGDTFHIDRDVNDGSSKDRLVTFSAIAVAPLAPGSAIAFTFASTTAYHINVDEFAGVGTAENGAAATGTATTWNSGTATAASGGDLFFGAVGNESGIAPTWASGWIPLPMLTIGKDHLDAGYQLASGAGALAAGGSSTGTWLAALTAYRPAGPPPDAAPVARVTVTPASVVLGSGVSANASASTDTDSTPIASYKFDFGDGSAPVTQSGASFGHTYSSVGSYTVTVTVTDTASLVGSVTAPVTVLPGSTGSPIRVSAGYYDTHHKHLLQTKPDPWQGSSGVVFVGAPDSSSGGWDTSAVKIDNLTDAPLTGVTVTVTIAGYRYALWGTNTIPVGSSLILAQTGFENFDGSDHHKAGCYGCDPKLCTTSVDTSVPTIAITIGSTTTTYHDTGLILSTGGVDRAGCPYTGTRNDESEPWQVVPT